MAVDDRQKGIDILHLENFGNKTNFEVIILQLAYTFKTQYMFQEQCIITIIVNFLVNFHSWICAVRNPYTI